MFTCTCFSFVNGYFKVKNYLLYASKDMMFFKVITITLITICAADDQLLFSELLSEPEEAPPVLSYKRHVIFPMLYKYSKIDEYSTPSSKSRSVRSARSNGMFWKLQYAPLHDGTRNSENPTPTHSNAPVEPTEIYQDKKSRHYSKSHLEPRTEGTAEKWYARPNKKAKASSSASRSPGHNAVYRKISEPSLKEKPVTDYVKPIGINLDLESLPTTTELPLLGLTADNKQIPQTVVKEHFVLNPNTLETDLPMRDQSKRYLSHPKYHRLHLNIARVYSPGQVPPKPPSYARAYPEHFGRPPKPPVYRSQTYQDQSKNTMLFPVKHHRKGNYRVHPSLINF